MFLAAVGVFGVVTAAVADRSREVGLRSALGATPVQIAVLLARDLAGIGVSGLLLGTVLMIPVSQFINRKIISEAQVPDVRSLLISLAALSLTTVAAAYVPAQRLLSRNPLPSIRN